MIEDSYAMNSENAMNILYALKEEDAYSQELSEKLESSRNSIANYLNVLRDRGLIERTKRNKRQYYGITNKGKRYLDKYEELQEKKQNLKEFEKGEDEI